MSLGDKRERKSAQWQRQSRKRGQDLSTHWMWKVREGKGKKDSEPLWKIMDKRKTHDPLASLLQFEHGAKISHECQPEIIPWKQTWDSHSGESERVSFVPLQKSPALLRRGRNLSWICFWLVQLVSALFDSRVIWMAYFITTHSSPK